MAATALAQNDNFHCPRILCLHGGGTNGEIMQLQCRALIRDLSSHFRLVFVDGPFFCAAHPAILPVYEAYGPYRRWLRWLPSHPSVEDATLIGEIEYQLEAAMAEDSRLGGHGPWIGLLGFSQGAKLAASILYETQLRTNETTTSDNSEAEAIKGFAGGTWKFAVCMAGRPPLVSLREEPDTDKPVERPGIISDPKVHENWGQIHDKLCLPTIHVHGLKDPGLDFHRDLLKEFCEARTSSVLEWNGDHRIPFKAEDVSPIVREIHRIANDEGILQN